MPLNPAAACPCQTGKPFAQCCGRFLLTDQQAKTPEQLMRSRFSAFALGGYGQYLLDTWAPEATSGMTAADLSERSTAWCGLKILKKSQQGELGMVEFKAFYVNEQGSEGCLHETSQFERRAGRWLYVSGEVHSD